MPNQSVKITKTVVEKAPLPETGQAFLRDTELKGFAVRLTPTGVRTFVVEKRIDGRVRRITLGRHTELTVAMANSAMALFKRGVCSSSWGKILYARLKRQVLVQLNATRCSALQDSHCSISTIRNAV